MTYNDCFPKNNIYCFHYYLLWNFTVYILKCIASIKGHLCSYKWIYAFRMYATRLFEGVPICIDEAYRTLKIWKKDWRAVKTVDILTNNSNACLFLNTGLSLFRIRARNKLVKHDQYWSNTYINPYTWISLLHRRAIMKETLLQN